jgi:hypothetical protein
MLRHALNRLVKGISKGKEDPVSFFHRALRNEGVLGEWRYSSTHSFTSALDGGECSASRPGRFTRRERASSTHWIGGWVGPRTGLDAVLYQLVNIKSENVH